MRATISKIVVATVIAACSWTPGCAQAQVASGSPSIYVAPHMTHESFGDLRVVVPLSSGEKMVQFMKIRNISNSIKAVSQWGGSIDVTVVLYARGVSLLVAPDEAMRMQIDKLRAQHVKFKICNNSLLEQNIDFHALYGVNEDDIVPAGFAEVAFLQAQKHYVVDPMN